MIVCGTLLRSELPTWPLGLDPLRAIPPSTMALRTGRTCRRTTFLPGDGLGASAAGEQSGDEDDAEQSDDEVDEDEEEAKVEGVSYQV